MKELYKELLERQEYLESQEYSEQELGRQKELNLIIVRVQQLLIPLVVKQSELLPTECVENCEGLVEYFVRWRHIPMDLYMTPLYLISIDHTRVKAKPSASDYDLMIAVSKEFKNMNISPDDVSIESFEQLPFA